MHVARGLRQRHDQGQEAKTEKPDEVKCDFEKQQGEYAHFLKSEVKESLTEKRSEQSMRLMAEMKEQLEKSADRITTIEQANKGPVDKQMEVTVVAIEGLQVKDGMKETFATKMAERIMAGVGGEVAKEVLNLEEIKVEQAWFGEKGLKANTNDDTEFNRTLYLAFEHPLPALAVLAAIAPSKEGVKVIKYVTSGGDGKGSTAQNAIKGWIETDSDRFKQPNVVRTEVSGEKFNILYIAAPISHCMKSMITDTKISETKPGVPIHMESILDANFRAPIPTIKTSVGGGAGGAGGDEGRADAGMKRKAEAHSSEQRRDSQEGGGGSGSGVRFATQKSGGFSEQRTRR